MIAFPYTMFCAVILIKAAHIIMAPMVVRHLPVMDGAVFFWMISGSATVSTG